MAKARAAVAERKWQNWVKELELGVTADWIDCLNRIVSDPKPGEPIEDLAPPKTGRKRKAQVPIDSPAEAVKKAVSLDNVE